MHDWTLKTLFIDWELAKVTIIFDRYIDNVEFIAEDFSLINIPQKKEWGPSVSVYKLLPIKILDDGNSQVEIQMQTGDMITIVAKKITLPPLDK